MSSFLILSILIGTLSFAKTEIHTQQPFHFMSEADDVEKEAWWLITGKRHSNDQSPWRFVYKAFLEFKGSKTKHVITKMCQKLKVVETTANSIFKVTTHCQAKPIEIALVKKLNDKQWEFQFRVTSFIDHFGLGTSIFYQTLICQIDLDEKNKVQKMRCPVYARNRSVEEIVELKNFEYNKKGEPLMKIQGVIKKQFQDVARIETSVPSKGEIIIKEIKIPNPLEAVKTEEFKIPKESVINNIESPKLNEPTEKIPDINEGEAVEEAPPISPSR